VDVQFRPATTDAYLAVLSLRHPNVSGSAAAVFFHVSAAVNSAAPAATATATATSLALFNPLVNPRIVCAVTLPHVAAAAYAGGLNKLTFDFAAVVAANAGARGRQLGAGQRVGHGAACV
jgi:hypothetical protein